MNYSEIVPGLPNLCFISQTINSRFKRHFTHWFGAVLLLLAGTAYADHTTEHDVQSLKGGLGAIEQRLWDCENGVGGACPGTTGPEGPQGGIGPIGLTGTAGVDGATGSQGATGDTGPQGDIGPVGATGDTGQQGIQGIQGLTGDKGDQGIQGLTGDVGATGAVGPQGLAGANGINGVDSTVPGPPGSQGPAGAGGLAGAKGDTGAKGDAGPQGIQGATGPAGTADEKLYKVGDFGPAGGVVIYVATQDGVDPELGGRHGIEMNRYNSYTDGKAVGGQVKHYSANFGCGTHPLNTRKAAFSRIGTGDLATEHILISCPDQTQQCSTFSISPSYYGISSPQLSITLWDNCEPANNWDMPAAALLATGATWDAGGIIQQPHYGGMWDWYLPNIAELALAYHMVNECTDPDPTEFATAPHFNRCTIMNRLFDNRNEATANLEEYLSSNTWPGDATGSGVITMCLGQGLNPFDGYIRDVWPKRNDRTCYIPDANRGQPLRVSRDTFVAVRAVRKF